MDETDKYIQNKNNAERVNKQDINEFYTYQTLSCPLKIYRQKTINREHPIETLRIFMSGELIKDFFRDHIPGSKQVNVKVHEGKYFGDLIISGRIDLITETKDHILYTLLKPMASIQYVKQNPAPNHIAELNLLMPRHNLESPKAPKRGRLIYIDKVTLETVEYELTYNEGLAKLSIDNFQAVKKALMDKRPPKRPENHKSYLFPCNYCLYRKECYGGD